MLYREGDTAAGLCSQVGAIRYRSHMSVLDYCTCGASCAAQRLCKSAVVRDMTRRTEISIPLPSVRVDVLELVQEVQALASQVALPLVGHHISVSLQKKSLIEDERFHAPYGVYQPGEEYRSESGRSTHTCYPVARLGALEWRRSPFRGYSGRLLLSVHQLPSANVHRSVPGPISHR